jgi:hypothetical protein
MADLPARRLDRAQLERIMRRAAELQATDRDLTDGLTPDEVVALAKEVGIPESHVRRALIEERHTPIVAGPASWTDDMVGRADLAASRIVPGDPARVQQELLNWMSRHEVLAVQRQVPGRIVWERLGGLQGAMKRSSAALGGDRTFMLTKAAEVTAEITAVEAGWSQVTLTLDATPERNARLLASGISGSLCAVAGGILAVLHAPLIIAAAAFAPGVVASVLIARSFRPTSTRLALGLDRVLDHLEHARYDPSLPPNRPGLLGMLAEELRKAL